MSCHAKLWHDMITHDHVIWVSMTWSSSWSNHVMSCHGNHEHDATLCYCSRKIRCHPQKQNVNIIPKRPSQELSKTYLTLGKLPWDRIFLSTSSLLGGSKANIHTSKNNGNNIYSDETKHRLEQFNIQPWTVLCIKRGQWGQEWIFLGRSIQL